MSEQVEAKVAGRIAFSSHPLTVDIFEGELARERVCIHLDDTALEKFSPYQIDGENISVAGRVDASPR